MTSYNFRHSLHLIAIIIALLYAKLAVSDPLLNGISVHSEFGNEQFVGGLFTSTLSSSAKDVLLSDEEKRIQVRVTSEQPLRSRRFKKMWIEGMAINASPNELSSQSNNMAKFSNMLKVKLLKGDIFTIDRSSELVTVSINGATLGTIDDPKFFDLLLRTWIGPVPLSSEFRRELLVEGNVDADLLARFESTRPDDERIAAITSALAEANAAAPAARPPRVVPQIAQPEPVARTPEPEQASEPDVPQIAAPAIQAPVAEATPAPAPTPTPAEVAQATPVPVKNTTTALLSDSIFDEEDEEEFTAEALLTQQLYTRKLKSWSQKKLRYPADAVRKDHEGSVRLQVTIARNGKVNNIEVLKDSPYRSLNKEARRAVKDASPFPRMPDAIKGDSFTFTLPVVFKLLDR